MASCGYAVGTAELREWHCRKENVDVEGGPRMYEEKGYLHSYLGHQENVHSSFGLA
jgi:hypothetical protein